MNNEEVWVKLFSSILEDSELSKLSYGLESAVKHSAKIADLALEEYKSRKQSKRFEENEGGYRG